MGSPTPLIVIFTVYFSFLNIGPKIMKERKPFNLTTIIRLYNIFQVISCLAFSFAALNLNYNVFTATWKCLKFEDHLQKGTEIKDVFVLYWYFMMLRTSELIETVFFILRKKTEQVSFLHVYHHVSTIVFLYILNRYSASKLKKIVRIFPVGTIKYLKCEINTQ